MRQLLVVAALCTALAAPFGAGLLAQEPKPPPPVVPARLSLHQGATYALRFTETARAKSETDGPRGQSSNDQQVHVICDVQFTVAAVDRDGGCKLDVTVTRVQGSYESPTVEKDTFDKHEKTAKPGKHLLSQIGHVSHVTVSARGAVLSVEGAATALAEKPSEQENLIAFFDRFFVTLPDEPQKRTGKWSSDRFVAPEFLLAGQHVIGRVEEDYRVKKLTPDAATVSVAAKGKKKIAKPKKKKGLPTTEKQMETFSVKGTMEIDPATGLCLARETVTKVTTYSSIGGGYDIVIEGEYEYETRLEAVDPPTVDVK